MMRNRNYGRGDPRVYGDKCVTELHDNERDKERISEQRGYSPRHHHGDRGGGGGEDEMMRIGDRKYMPGQGGVEFDSERIREGCVGVHNGVPLHEQTERLMRDYVKQGKVEEPRMQGEEEEEEEGEVRHDVVSVGEGGNLCKPTESLRREYNRHSNIVDGKYSPGCGVGNFERQRMWQEEERCAAVGVGVGIDTGASGRHNLHKLPQDSSGRDYAGIDTGAASGGHNLHKLPQGSSGREYEMNFDSVVDGKNLHSCGAREFKRLRTSDLPVEKDRCLGATDGDNLHELSRDRLARDYRSHFDIVDGKKSLGHGGGEFQRLRTWGIGEQEGRHFAVCDSDGNYLHKLPQERFQTDYNSQSSVVEHSPGCGGGKFEKLKGWSLAEEEAERLVHSGVGDGDSLHELPHERFQRNCNKRDDICERKNSSGPGGGVFERSRMSDLGEAEERHVFGGVGDRGNRHPNTVDEKYLCGCGGGDVERMRTWTSEEEEERRVGNRDGDYLPRASQGRCKDGYQHPNMFYGKNSPGHGGVEVERLRICHVGKGHYGGGVSGGFFLHEAPHEKLHSRYSDIVDGGKKCDGGLLCNYCGPYKDRNDNNCNGGCSPRFYQLNEDLLHVGSHGLKFKGNHRFNDHENSDGLEGSAGVGGAVCSKRDCFSQRYLDTYQYEQLLDSNILPSEAGKIEGYSSFYPLDVSVPPKSYGIGGGGVHGSSLPCPGTGLHKGECCCLHRGPYVDKVARDFPMEREVCSEDNPLHYPKDEYYVGSSTHPSGGFKEELTTVRQGNTYMGRSERDCVAVGSQDIHGSSVGVAKENSHDDRRRTSCMDPIVDRMGQLYRREGSRPWDHHSYLQGQTTPQYVHAVGSSQGRKHSMDVLGHGDMCRSKGHCSASRAQDIHGSFVSIAEEYSHRDMLRASYLDPVLDRSGQFYHGDFSRPHDHHSDLREQPTPEYVNAVGSSQRRKHDLDVLDYGDSYLEYETVAYKDYGDDEPAEPSGCRIGYGPWSNHEISDMLISVEYNDSPSGRLSPVYSSLPKPSGHGKTGRKNRGVSSLLTSQDLPESMSSLWRKSQKSTQDIKAQLGNPKDIHISHSDKISQRVSVKNRLGPRSQVGSVPQPETRKNRSSVKNRLGPGPRQISKKFR